MNCNCNCEEVRKTFHSFYYSQLPVYHCKIVRKMKCRINPSNNGIVCILGIEYLNILVSLSLYMWEKQVYYNPYYRRDYLHKVYCNNIKYFIHVYVYRERLHVHKYKICILSFTFLRWSNNKTVLKSVMKMKQKFSIWQELRSLRSCLGTIREKGMRLEEIIS